MFRTNLLIVCLCLLLCPGVQAASDLGKQQASLEQVRSRIAKLTRAIEKQQSDQDALTRELQALERQAATLREEAEAQRSQIADQKRRIETTTAEREEAEQALKGGLESLRRQMRTAYMVGRQGQTQLLLRQNDAQHVGRILVYYDYLQRAQTGVLTEIQQRVRALDELTERLQTEVERLSEIARSRETTLKRLEQSQRDRRNALNKIKKRLTDERGTLKQLQADERSIQQLIERLRDTLSDLPADNRFYDQPFTKLKGKLPWPVRGKLLASYGAQKAGGKLNWKGHWIAADEGDPVKAVARGRVVYVGWMHRYGLIVLIEHEGSYYSLYGHNSSTTVKVGDGVKAGQVIARAGNTGGHEQFGVYFELRHKADAIDPRRWLAR
ncbi:MAG: peptidoglycan DD-metalloendopeptidase family protein [Nevskiales bacterium]|nr:peptidoglycan DD-metalloendopeptidase family protein [Nevskiales bacterium]